MSSPSNCRYTETHEWFRQEPDGTVTAVNDAAHKDPSLLNSDPFGKGWLVRLSGCDLSKAAGLMDAAAYDKQNGH